jgi:hypothetical protein
VVSYLFLGSLGGRAVQGVDLGCLIAGIAGSNPARGMEVCRRVFMLCCYVSVEAFATR